jgi:rubrerythrin
MVNMWECEVCGHKNTDEEDVCENCGAHREESSYDAIADEDDE